MTTDDPLLADRSRIWRDFSRLLFWGPIHAAVILIVVVLFAVNGPTAGTIVGSVILIGANLAITVAHFLSKRW